MARLVITIDGPAASGKSTVARLLAETLGMSFLDTGAMYRAITLKCLREGIPHTETDALVECVKRTSMEFAGSPPDMKVWMDGNDVTDAVRSDEVTKNVSDYCKPKAVRDELVKQQRRMAESGIVVCEGRDIGTVVFPNAELKFYMFASVEERAKRRKKDFRPYAFH